MTDDTSAAVAALRAAIASIDAQIAAGPNTEVIDRKIATLQEEIRKLRASRKVDARPLTKRRTELVKAITLITGSDEPERPKVASGGSHACAVCGVSFSTAQGVAMHRRRAHEGFNPGHPASDAPPARDPDRALPTLHDHRQPLAEHVDLEQARELIETRAS